MTTSTLMLYKCNLITENQSDKFMYFKSIKNIVLYYMKPILTETPLYKASQQLQNYLKQNA